MNETYPVNLRGIGDTGRPKNSPLGRGLAIAGAVLQLGAIIGFLGGMVGMMRAIQTLGQTGISSPSLLSSNIGEVLLMAVIGITVSGIGIILLSVALFALRYRAPWFFWFLVVYGAVLLLGFPVGTIFGGTFLVFCIARKDEFLKRCEPSAA